MRKSIALFALAGMLLFLSACALAIYPRYNPEAATPPPADYVLVISKIKLVPPLEQKVKPMRTIGLDPPQKNDFIMYLSPSSEPPLQPRKMIPMPIKNAGNMSINMREFSFTMMPPGKRYIRYGTLTYDEFVAGTTIRGGAPVPHKGFRDLRILPDAEIDIPAGAKAVYIGTFVIEHDGNFSRKVTVKDEYKAALKALKKQNIPGIGPKDVKKKLAKVVRQYEDF